MSLEINRPNTCTVDRLIPGNNGGTYAEWNIVGACYTCNNNRGKDFPQEVREFALRRRDACGGCGGTPQINDVPPLDASLRSMWVQLWVGK